MSYWTPQPPPESRLARYRVLCPSASVRVSPICLGAMNVGENNWQAIMGAMDKEASFKFLDAFYDAGGNFIDTANTYQNEASEMVLGEWMEKRGNRDQMVIATKYTTNYKRGDESIPIKVNYVGNSVKSMHISVEASLKKLRTSYIDILYVHWWDFTATVKEVMDALHHLVAERKVLYLGISDAPAWVVSKANEYARCMGKTPFVIYQGQWNVMKRSFERDIIPMCRDEGMAIAPWDVLNGGRFRSDEEEERRRQTGEKGRAVLTPDWERTEDEKKMCAALEKVAKDVGTEHLTSVAIAYVMHKAPFVIPIVGGRKVEQLQANLDALKISLSDEQMEYLESIFPFDVGFPNWQIGDGNSHPMSMAATAYVEPHPRYLPIRPTSDNSAQKNNA